MVSVSMACFVLAVVTGMDWLLCKVWERRYLPL
jgi:hypothetical protein